MPCMNNDYPKISGLHFDERSGVYRRCLPCGRIESNLRFHFSPSSSSSSAASYNGNASGQAQQAQGNKNAIGNTTTTVKNSASNSNNSTTNSGNKVSVAKGGNLNYVTNTAGFSAADIGNLFKSIGGGGSGGGTGAAGGGGVSVFTTPNAALSTASTSSTVKWAIIAAVATVIGVLWSIYRKKS